MVQLNLHSPITNL